jgi:Heparinase II/III N-terminus
MPSVATFERELDGLAGEARDALLTRASAVGSHRFDLPGSGPIYLGERIDWQRDFKSGRRWHLVSLVPLECPDDSDIKVPWELSRFQHLPVLAAAHRLTGDPRYLHEVGAQLDDWIERNPVESGVGQLGLHHGGRDPSRQLGSDARHVRRGSGERALVPAGAGKPAPARTIHPAPPGVVEGPQQSLPLGCSRTPARRRGVRGECSGTRVGGVGSARARFGDGAPGATRRL